MACDSWRRFHLRNWRIITAALTGTLGSSLVVMGTLGMAAAVGSWVLVSLAYLVGLTTEGRV